VGLLAHPSNLDVISGDPAATSTLVHSNKWMTHMINFPVYTIEIAPQTFAGRGSYSCMAERMKAQTKAHPVDHAPSVTARRSSWTSSMTQFAP
jgi:hypothetical protein